MSSDQFTNEKTCPKSCDWRVVERRSEYSFHIYFLPALYVNNSLHFSNAEQIPKRLSCTLSYWILNSSLEAGVLVFQFRDEVTEV